MLPKKFILIGRIMLAHMSVWTLMVLLWISFSIKTNSFTSQCWIFHFLLTVCTIFSPLYSCFFFAFCLLISCLSCFFLLLNSFTLYDLSITDFHLFYIAFIFCSVLVLLFFKSCMWISRILWTKLKRIHMTVYYFCCLIGNKSNVGDSYIIYTDILVLSIVYLLLSHKLF